MWQRVEVCVGADAIVHASAEQGIDWAISRFAKNVPAGNFKARERAHDGQIGALCEA